MSKISEEVLAQAREMDLLTYLMNYNPGNLKHVSGDVYCTQEHDSLIISNGKWNWFSRNIGGRTALDYLIKVEGIPFRDAVERIVGRIEQPRRIIVHRPVITPVEKKLVMPELCKTTDIAESYLKSRAIDGEIIRWCVDHALIFESEKYHNVLFIGYDKENTPRYGAVRSTSGSYKGDLKGSDKRFAFRVNRNPSPEHLHVFESAPDLMSYLTFLKIYDADWESRTCLSLAGISSAGHDIPRALEQFLKDYPSVKAIRLHLDSDEPGRAATESITKALEGKYEVIDEPPRVGKDINEDLIAFKGMQSRKKKVEVR